MFVLSWVRSLVLIILTVNETFTYAAEQLARVRQWWQQMIILTEMRAYVNRLFA